MTLTEASSQQYGASADRNLMTGILEATFGGEVTVCDVYYLRSYEQRPEAVVKIGEVLLVVTCRLSDGRRERMEYPEIFDASNQEHEMDLPSCAIPIMQRIAGSQPTRERFLRGA